MKQIEKSQTKAKEKLIEDSTEFFLTTDSQFRELMKHLGTHKEYKMADWQIKCWKDMLYSLNRLRKRAQNAEDLFNDGDQLNK